MKDSISSLLYMLPFKCQVRYVAEVVLLLRRHVDSFFLFVFFDNVTSLVHAPLTDVTASQVERTLLGPTHAKRR